MKEKHPEFKPFSLFRNRVVSLITTPLAIFLHILLIYYLGNTIIQGSYDETFFFTIAFTPILMPFIIYVLWFQPPSNTSKDEKFYYFLKLIHFSYKKQPYGIIDFSDIDKVVKFTKPTGDSVLVKVYTDEKIHYLGHPDIIGNFLYELEKRSLKHLIEEKNVDPSFFGGIAMRLKGGKIIQK